MNGVLLASLLLAAGPAVEVRTLDGRTVDGTLDSLDKAGLTIAGAEGPEALPLDNLLWLAPKKSPEPAKEKPAAWIELIDGSSLLASQYSVSEGQATVALLDGRQVTTPVARVASVRLAEQTEATAKQWSQFLTVKAANDLLVVRRSEVLDYHKGIVRDVTEEVVKFDFDGDVLPVKRSKVWGLVYFRPPAGTLPENLCRLVDASGSQWPVHTLSLAEDGELQCETPGGIAVSLPWASIRKVDFSHGKIVYLTELEPQSLEFTPFFGTAEQLPIVAQFFGPRSNQSLSGGPLKLGEEVYENGLALHSRTELTYRLPGRFSRFKAVAGIDGAVRPGGHVRLVIRGDENVLLESLVTGEDDEPLSIDVDLTGARRLTILVDFGDKTDIADHLDLCEARIIK